MLHHTVADLAHSGPCYCAYLHSFILGSFWGSLHECGMSLTSSRLGRRLITLYITKCGHRPHEWRHHALWLLILRRWRVVSTFWYILVCFWFSFSKYSEKNQQTQGPNYVSFLMSVSHILIRSSINKLMLDNLLYEWNSVFIAVLVVVIFLVLAISDTAFWFSDFPATLTLQLYDCPRTLVSKRFWMSFTSIARFSWSIHKTDNSGCSIPKL